MTPMQSNLFGYPSRRLLRPIGNAACPHPADDEVADVQRLGKHELPQQKIEIADNRIARIEPRVTLEKGPAGENPPVGKIKIAHPEDSSGANRSHSVPTLPRL